MDNFLTAAFSGQKCEEHTQQTNNAKLLLGVQNKSKK